MSRKFFRYLVFERGIKANPEKIKAILEMNLPMMMKDVQRLAGWISALSQFIPQSADKCLEFFRILRNHDNFE